MSLHSVRPKILGFISEDVSAWLVALLVLLFGCVLTGLLAWSTLNLYQQQLRQRFQLLASERYSRIEERFEDQEQRLDGLKRFFINSGEVSRQDFDGYTQPLLHRTQAYAWAPRVSGTERASFERMAQEQGAPNYFIADLNAEGKLQRAAERDEYIPVLYSQTQSPLGSPLGFDLLAQPMRRDTLERARLRGGVAVSQPVRLVGVEPSYARGIILASPVSLRADVAMSTPEPYGYVIAVISMRQLVVDGLPEQSQDNLFVQIIDLSTAESYGKLYESSNGPGDSQLAVSRVLSLADHDYRVNIRPSALFLQANHSSVSSQVILGTLLSLLLSALLYVLVSQRQRALRLVEQRTEELRVREQELRGTHGQLRSVLNAATQVAIIATDLRGVISTFNAGAERMLGYKSAEVVGHLTLESLHLPAELNVRAQALSQRYGRQIPMCQAMLVDGSEESGDETREWTLVRHDGSHLVVNMLATPVLDDYGLWVGHLAICIDITERKRVHEALAARDRLLKNSVPMCLAVSTSSRWMSEVMPVSLTSVTASATFTRSSRNSCSWTPSRCSSAFTPAMWPGCVPRSGRRRRDSAPGARSIGCNCRSADCAGCAARRPRKGWQGAGCCGMAICRTSPTSSGSRKSCGPCRSPTR